MNISIKSLYTIYFSLVIKVNDRIIKFYSVKRFIKLQSLLTFIFLYLLLSVSNLQAQLSDLHYLPPLKQESNNIGIQGQAIYLSTPVITSFTVKVYRGASNTPISTFSISKSSPYVYALGTGDNNITFVDNANTGIVISNSGLRFESENGEKFYVNYRGSQSAQGSSLTSKGRAALGKRFRWGGGPVIWGDNTNATLGIMASEDGTTVQIFGYDENIVFRKGEIVDAIKDDNLSITLNKGQSFVLEYPIRKLPNYSTSKIYDEWMGASIVSDKNIVVSLGNALYSPSNDGARDIAIDQIIPENVLGNEYVFVRGYGADNLEFPIIIATQNDTEIYVNDAITPVTTIDAGEYYLVPGSNYSGSGIIREGENMYVRASKQIYAYQSTAGANYEANVDYNFIAPINFLLDKEVNFIPDIQKVGPNTNIQGGISIISAASTPDSDVQVFVNGVPQSLAGKRKAINGFDSWVTYFLDGLSGNVSVISTNSIAVGYTGASGVVGVSGYFSGFETIPSINVSVNVVGNCLQDGNVLLSAPQGYAIYQWYLEGSPVSGATQSTLVPNLAGSYTVGITQSVDGKEYVSAPVDVSDCLPEIKLDVTSSKQTLSVDESTTLSVNYKYQSFFSASNAEVTLSIPSNFLITANKPSVGSWSDSEKKWILGNVNPGNEEVLELTLKAITVGSSVTVTANNSQSVFGSDNVTPLNEGNNIADDLSEVFTIKNTTVINSPSPIAKTVLDDDFSLVATSNNPNPFSYSSSNEGIVKVGTNGTVEIISVGTATITLSQLETESFAVGTSSVSVTVSKATPSLSSFPNINKTFGDPNFQLTVPTSSSEGVFSYTSSDTAIATVNASTGLVTILRAGTAIITASQAATPNYNSSSIAATINISKAAQIITVGSLPDEKTILERIGPGGSDSSIPISAISNAGSAVTISLPSGSIGVLSGSVGNYSVTSVSGPGTLSINFDAPENINYNSASISISLDVSKKPQNISFSPAMPSSITFSDNLSVPITASSPSSTTMVYSVLSGPATISNGELIISGTGVVVYSVNNQGDVIYTKASEVIKELEVVQGTTTLSNFNIADITFDNRSVTIPTPTSNRTGDFIFSSNNTIVASVSGTDISVNTIGTVTITATQPATENWTGASISTTFDVIKATPVLTGLTTISKKTIDPDFIYSVSSTLPADPIVFRSSDLSVAKVNSSTGLISIEGIGTSVITASQAANTNYNSASISLTVIVEKADPTLGSISNIVKTKGDANFSITAPSSDSGGAFSFISADTGVVTINNITGEVSIMGTGTSVITVNQGATANYNAASTTLTVTIRDDVVLITGPNSETGLASAKSINENATAVHTFSADRTVTWSLGNTNDFALFNIDSNGNLAFNTAPDFENPSSTLGSNTYVVEVIATDGNNNSTTQTLTISVLDIPITTFGGFAAINKQYFVGTYTIVPPTTNNSSPIVYTSDNMAVATVSGSVITFTGVGTANITATQAADLNYEGNSVSTLLTVLGKDLVTTNGGISSTDITYVDANGKLGGSLGIDKYGSLQDIYEDLVTSGLIMHLDAGNTASYPGTGNLWNDISGNGNHGTLVNNPLYNSSNDGNLVFNGTNNYVNAPLTKTASCTFSVWAKSININSPSMLFNAGNNQSGPDLFFNVGIISWNTWDNNNNPFGNIPSTASDGNWHNYVVVNDAVSNTTKLYYDGVLYGTATYRNASTNTTLYIGGNNTTYFWNGSIGNFQVHNRVLSALEVVRNFNYLKLRYGL